MKRHTKKQGNRETTGRNVIGLIILLMDILKGASNPAPVKAPKYHKYSAQFVTMTRVLTNSPFGVIVRLFSGGRLFTPTEQRADFTIPWPYQLASDKNNNKTQEVLHSNNDSALLSPLPVDDKMSLGIDNEAQKSVTTTPQEAQQEQDQEQSAWIPPEVTPDGAILVDWFSADDPDNPQNWSFAAKLLVYIEVCLFTFMVYMSAAVFSAASGEFEYSFGTTRTVSSLGLALYVLGYGMGPMIWSPMSEIPSIGRNPPCVTSVTFFLIISVPTAIVNNAPGFFVLRFLQGFFGSPGLATGGASLADVAGPMSLPYGLYAWSVCSISGPALGPTISGFSVPVMGWRWSMWEIVWAAGLCFAFLVGSLLNTFSKETSLLTWSNSRSSSRKPPHPPSCTSEPSVCEN